MRILLTGGSGQVGGEFLRRAQGLDVRAPGRAEFDLADAARMRDWLARERPALILNAGAYTAVDRAEDEPALAHRINADAVRVLAQYAQAHTATLIQLSTDYVFDGRKGAPYQEQDAPAPLGVYGASKLAGEQAARIAPRHLILRVGWVFAAQGGNFVRTLLRLAHERERLRVVDDQFGGPTWAGDIAASLRVLVDRVQAGQALPVGLWHHGSAPHLSWCAFARAILDGAQAHGLIARLPQLEAIATRDYPTRAPRPADTRLDSRAAAQVLGLPVPDWRAGLDATLAELAAPP